MVQSVMRYNQMFTIQTNITIPLDVSIKAGDLIHCDFPELKVQKVRRQMINLVYIYVSTCLSRGTPQNRSVVFHL